MSTKLRSLIRRVWDFLCRYKKVVIAVVVLVVIAIGYTMYLQHMQTVQQTVDTWTITQNPPGVKNDTVNLGKALEKLPNDMPPDVPRISSSFQPVDQLLGGHVDKRVGFGFPRGTVTIIAGPPGAGKTTVSSQLALAFADRGLKTTMISSEETVEQMLLKLRRFVADRFTEMQKEMLNITATTDVTAVKNRIAREKPDVVILDSLQGFEDVDKGSRKGSLINMQKVAGLVSDYIKQKQPHGIGICISQIVKSGTIAGPKSLQHLGDLILYVKGSGRVRWLDPYKNRYNATTQMLRVEMTPYGLALQKARAFDRDEQKIA